MVYFLVHLFFLSHKFTNEAGGTFQSDVCSVRILKSKCILQHSCSRNEVSARIGTALGNRIQTSFVAVAKVLITIDHALLCMYVK